MTHRRRRLSCQSRWWMPRSCAWCCASTAPTRTEPCALADAVSSRSSTWTCSSAFWAPPIVRRTRRCRSHALGNARTRHQIGADAPALPTPVADLEASELLTAAADHMAGLIESHLSTSIVALCESLGVERDFDQAAATMAQKEHAYTAESAAHEPPACAFVRELGGPDVFDLCLQRLKVNVLRRLKG
eukprot:6064753-Prymnesium_polylepis.2